LSSLKGLIVGAVSAAFLVPASAAPQSPSGADLSPGILIIQRIGVIGLTSVQIEAAPALTGNAYGAANFALIPFGFWRTVSLAGRYLGAPDWFSLDGFDVTSGREPGEGPREFSRRALVDALTLSMHFETSAVLQ
jgi:hypothetical protein